MARAYREGISELMRSDAVDAAVEYHAERVLRTARAIAPVDSGDYVRSLRAERTGPGTFEVGTDIDYALPVESRDGTLARALNMTPREDA